MQHATTKRAVSGKSFRRFCLPLPSQLQNEVKRNDLSREELLVKMEGWCAAEERCSADIRRKLREMGGSPADVAFILQNLVSEGFLDEERYARAFVRGKFNSRRWGRRRLEAELRQRQIGAVVIHQALEEISEADYMVALTHLAKQKGLQEAETDFHSRRKLFAYLMQKGYEPGLISKVLNSSGDEIDFFEE